VSLVPWPGLFVATPAPTVHTDRGCYLIGQQVKVSGSGFAPDRSFTVTIDGVDFGESTTDSGGGFSSSLVPGGLGAGVAQHVDHLVASDGSHTAGTTFTLTRPRGARFLATRGNPHTLRAPFELWDFGAGKAIYLHYVAPSGHLRKTVRLGAGGGQCGYLKTRRRKVFPFSPSKGRWTLQIDTQNRYAAHPSGAVARIRVKIS
jgi:hypothetical protein